MCTRRLNTTLKMFLNLLRARAHHISQCVQALLALTMHFAEFPEFAECPVQGSSEHDAAHKPRRIALLATLGYTFQHRCSKSGRPVMFQVRQLACQIS